VKVKILVTGLVALTLGALSASAAVKPGTKAVPRFSSDALLAADVPWATVQAVAGKSFWPELPAFNSIIDEEDPQPLTAVAQTYSDVGGSARVITRLYAYASPAIALEYLQSAAIVVGNIDQEAPAIGDNHFYYVTTLTSGEPSTRLYFTRGQIGAEIRVDGQLWSRDKIARLANPLNDRLGQLLDGSLRAPSVPEVQLVKLPQGRDAPGPVLGTASVPAESWALVVHNGSPRALRARLAAGGNTTFPFRRYLRQGSRTDAIEVALFTFPSTAAAQSWAAPFMAGVKAHPADALDAGATGSSSAFRLQLENYELQFVKGKVVADVFCYAPFTSKVSESCEAATRKLAEAWYRELP
jgi:hypothetical protein